jgi:hypothetical protein
MSMVGVSATAGGVQPASPAPITAAIAAARFASIRT